MAASDQTSSAGRASSGGDVWLTRASLFDRLNAPDGVGREIAWAEFHARYAPIIAGFARRCGAARADVEDIVGDVMAAFFSASSDFAYDPARGRFRGWLKTVTVRAALRRAGKNLRCGGVPLADVPEPAVEALWNDVWEQELVARALAILGQELGQSVAFRAFEAYVLRERAADAVAADLGVSVETVYQAKTRLTRRLRETVAKLRAADG